MATQLNQAFWDNQYQQGQTGWDIGRVSPPLQHYIDQLEDKNISILIPGAGNSHEAFYLLEKGFTDITVLDIAPTVIYRLKEKTKENSNRIKLIADDFFAHTGQYDLILEQTFFCALDPSLRSDYARHMHALLKAQGRLAGVLFNVNFDFGPPPFGGHEHEYRQLLAPYFDFHTWEPCYNSLPPRAGTEWFMMLTKR